MTLETHIEQAGIRIRPSLADEGLLLALRQLGERNNVFDCVWEYVQNAVDAGATNISLKVGRKGGESFFSIGDDGHGMYYSDDDEESNSDTKLLTNIVKNLGNSAKKRAKQVTKNEKGRIIKGEHGTGSLVWLSLVEESSESSAKTGTITWDTKAEEKKPVRLTLPNNMGLVVPGGLIDYHSNRGTQLGTTVVMTNLKRTTYDRLTLTTDLSRYLGFQFADLLKSGNLQISIERTGGKLMHVLPHNYDGVRKIDDTFQDPVFGDVRVELYFHPDKADSMVSIRNYMHSPVTDVSRQYPKIFSPDVWRNGRVEGFIYCESLPEKKQRSTQGGLDDGHPELERFLIEISSKYIERIQRFSKEYSSEKSRENITRAYKRAMRDLRQNPLVKSMLDEIFNLGPKPSEDEDDDDEESRPKGKGKSDSDGPTPRNPRGALDKPDKEKPCPAPKPLIGFSMREIPLAGDERPYLWEHGEVLVNASCRLYEDMVHDGDKLHKYLVQCGIRAICEKVCDTKEEALYRSLECHLTFEQE